MTGTPATPRWLDDQMAPVHERSSPQHVLVTLLGDYWMDQEGDLPSAALVALLGEFGVSSASARAALNRLLRRGQVDVRKTGRKTYYRLSDDSATRIREGGRRIIRFGQHSEWDRRWCVVVFSVPEDKRDSRHLLRSRLRWFGFAPLYDAVWVSPSADADTANQVLVDLAVTSATVFTATTVGGADSRHPLAAWDLLDLRRTYDEFTDRAEQICHRLRDGRVHPAEALVIRTRLMDDYRRFPADDPGLPDDEMPDGWPRARARAAFIAAYDALGPLAEVRVRQIVSLFDAEAADRARYLDANTMA